MSRRVLPCAAALALSLTACAVQMHPTPAPKLRTGAAEQIGPRLSNYGGAVIPQDGVISLWGDGFTGPDPLAPHTKGRAPSLAKDLIVATGLKVEDHSQPGQTAAEGLESMADAPTGAVVILCYGYADAATDLAAFKASLAQMIRLAHRRGAPVLLVAEPLQTPPTPVVPPKTLAPADQKKQDYINQLIWHAAAVHEAAVAEGAGVVDGAAVLSDQVIGTVNTYARMGSLLTPAEKQPQSPIATARIAHALAADIEVAR